ncbi:hypothetical protein OZX67_08140 [Bifidobacterium sp. ESL0728]|uniref:hypothetical protein n=1 Tax=Bifidobacterium sp. ESL0728 TaxID=2983220 RepID=UPI0023F8C8A4|nr:hypothetical protein [Bifidobacterium sp. ESL0728]WEV58752.1 hypothetical protein OZX67_08140 [Bifidobacterium sp. ESL0728]
MKSSRKNRQGTSRRIGKLGLWLRKIVVSIVVAVFALVALPACSVLKPAKSAPKTDPDKMETIVMPSQDDDKKKAAKEFKDSKDFTDVTVNKKGELVFKVTERQRKREIIDREHEINYFAAGFLSQKPEYHYTVSKDLSQFSIWLDKDAAPWFWGSYPFDSQILHYFQRKPGSFDMHVTMYNCHTGNKIDDYDGLNPTGHSWTQDQLGN